MAALKELLPPVKSTSATYYDHSNDPWFKQRFSSSEVEQSAGGGGINYKPVPLYLQRKGFVPRKVEDFGDGGAFPEIHVAQYPLDMGRNKSAKPGSKILALTVDAHGNVAYDAIVRQNENTKKIVYSQHKDLIPKILRSEEEGDEDGDGDEELQKEIEDTTLETKAALEKIVNVRLSAAQPKNVPKQSSDSKYIKYKPSQQSAAFNSGAKERIIRMVEMPVDPLEPPKFKHKRVPKASGSPPVPVMHSPPRPVTVKDQQDWKIPPCISNWKNPKGYTIPLDKRLAADGRGLQDVQINDNFAKLSEALYVAEQKAREAVAMRSKVQKEMMMKEKERKEQELRALAQKARSERTGAAPPPSAPVPSERGAMDDVDMRGDYEHVKDRERDAPKETREEREERLRREKIREERRRERERERRLEAKDAAMGKKSKITRDRDRDISEKVALGMASTGAGKGGEVAYDQRLFNQEKGMDSGFAADDQYSVYDKGLFTAQPTLSTLYRPKKDVDAQGSFGVSKNVATGPWGQESRVMNAETKKEDSSSRFTESKTREEKLLETIVTSGGVRLQPTRDAIQAFLEEAAKLNVLALSHALESKLQSPVWQARMKAVCLLESILRRKDDEQFSIAYSYFSENIDSVVRCSESPQNSLREKANKVLSLLGGEPLGNMVGNSVKAETAHVQMPDLMDTGDSDDFFGTDDSIKKQSEQHIVNPMTSTTPLIDDLFGDGVGTGDSTGEEQKNEDPFADVSFHTSEGREHGDDLFSGMTFDDKLGADENHMPANKNGPELFDIFGSNSEFLKGQENSETGVSDLMAGMSINDNVSKLQVTSPAVFSESLFSDLTSNPSHQVTNDALNGSLGLSPTGINVNPLHPSGTMPYNMHPGIMLNPAFHSQPINYAAMGNFLAQQQFLATMSNIQHLSNLNVQNAGVSHASGTDGGGYSSALPDIFQSNFPNQAPTSTMNSSKKEDTRAFDFISDHVAAARDPKRVA